MNLRDILELSKTAKKEKFSIYDMADILNIETYNIEDYNEENSKLEISRITSSWDSDTIIGETAYFFENELIGYSNQAGRKDSVTLFFISKEAHTKVVSYIKSFIKEDEPQILSDDKLNKEREDTYSVSFVSELIPSIQKYKANGIEVTLANRGSPYEQTALFNIGKEQAYIPLNDIKIDYFDKRGV